MVNKHSRPLLSKSLIPLVSYIKGERSVPEEVISRGPHDRGELFTLFKLLSTVDVHALKERSPGDFGDVAMGRLEVGVLDLGFMGEVEEILGDTKDSVMKAKRDVGVINDEAPVILKSLHDHFASFFP